MNHSLLLSILLIEVSLIISMCSTMTLFLWLNRDNREDKEYKYYFGHILSLDTLGINATLFIFSIMFIISDRNNNLWTLIFAIIFATFFSLYIILGTVLVVRIFLILNDYELNKYKEKRKNSFRYLYKKRSRNLHLDLYLAIALGIFIVCLVILNVGFKISLYWLVLAILLTLVVAIIFSLVLIVRNITNINSSISIKSTHNVTIAAAISISLAVALTAWGSISANAAMELPGAPNGLSKKMDDLEKSNHRLEVKLKEERKINIQNKNYIKKVFKENRKTNINIKKIINNKKIIKIIKSGPHTPTKKSPSPKKPVYQNPKGKLPDTGEAKGFWQW